MDIAPVEIRYYQTASKKRPFQEWLDGLDATRQQIVAVRLARVRRGLFGDAEPVGEGVFELKIDVGPGYRVYYALRGSTLLLLLAGGDKSTQQKDIAAATRLAREFSES